MRVRVGVSAKVEVVVEVKVTPPAAPKNHLYCTQYTRQYTLIREEMLEAAAKPKTARLALLQPAPHRLSVTIFFFILPPPPFHLQFLLRLCIHLAGTIPGIHQSSYHSPGYTWPLPGLISSSARLPSSGHFRGEHLSFVYPCICLLCIHLLFDAVSYYQKLSTIKCKTWCYQEHHWLSLACSQAWLICKYSELSSTPPWSRCNTSHTLLS